MVPHAGLYAAFGVQLGFHINVGTEFVPNTRLDPLIRSTVGVARLRSLRTHSRSTWMLQKLPNLVFISYSTARDHACLYLNYASSNRCFKILDKLSRPEYRYTCINILVDLDGTLKRASSSRVLPVSVTPGFVPMVPLGTGAERDTPPN